VGIYPYELSINEVPQKYFGSLFIGFKSNEHVRYELDVNKGNNVHLDTAG
jgi:hypothetical protein